MSRKNAELARWAFTSDPTRFFSLLDPEIEMDARRNVELPGAALTGRGREVIERYCREFWGTWAEYSAEPREIIDADEHVVVEVHERGEGKGSGVPFERVHFQVWTLANRRLVRWRLFSDRAEALEAAGLSE